MYEELINRLRERSVFMLPHHGEHTSYDANLMHQAADAIEDLIAALTASNEVIAHQRDILAEYGGETSIRQMRETLEAIDKLLSEPPKEGET